MSKHPKQRIAVGIDGSENSHAAVKWAIEHARQSDTVILVHVWHPYVYGTELATAFTIDDTAATELLEAEFVRFVPLAKEHEVMLKRELIEGDARDTLNIPNIDLLVIGARGHSGIAGILLGSVADYVTRHATVPVVVIPPDNRVTTK
ncbi:MAG: universal stress protein [Actinobacteria bacterium]|jgi:nucleotide-binding universal stress UspA family protein|nr:universal stress protein [Actinomycetota bacterium]